MSNILSRQPSVGNSLRVNATPANQNLSKIFGVPTLQNVYTFHLWRKKTVVGVAQSIFGVGTNHSLGYNSSDQLVLTINGTAYTSTAVYRDIAWQSILYSQNGTSYNVYVNGVAVLSGTSVANTLFNTATTHLICNNNGANWSDGYFAEITFVDGLSLTTDNFGYFDPHTNKWSPKQYYGDVGANGFYLPFNEGTSTTTLGYDKAPIRTNHTVANNWTLNNLTRAAGVNECWIPDSPTNNCVLLNMLDKHSTITLGNGALHALLYSLANGNAGFRANVGVSSGKWYWEVTYGNSQPGRPYCNIGIDPFNTDVSSINTVGTGVGSAYCYYSGNGNKTTNGTPTAYGSTFSVGDVIGVDLDMDNGTLTYYKQTGGTGAFVSQGVAFSGIVGTYVPSGALYTDTFNATYTAEFYFNFGQRPFNNTSIPTGRKYLNQLSINNKSGLRHSERWMDVATYTGSGTTLGVTSNVKNPDFVWIKNRTGSVANHVLFDSSRGITKHLSSSLTDTEYTESASAGITALTSTGFTLGTELAGGGSVNTNTWTYVAWVWKAGGTAVTNNLGTISSQVSTNPEAGFSIVTWSGSATANQTVGHGLGRQVDFALLKARGSVQNWIVWHRSVTSGNGKYLWLNTTDLLQGPSGTPVWDSGNTSTQSSTTLFTVGANLAVNNNTAPGMVMYAWSEIPGFSKFGSYVGNGVTDGPFVYCGFRPKWVLLKDTTVSQRWYIHDSAREIYNQMAAELNPDQSFAEANLGAKIDFVFNGFKLRDTNNANGNGNTIIFAAFAEYPMSDAVAR